MEELRLAGRALLAVYVLVGAWNNTTDFKPTLAVMRTLRLPLPVILLPIVILYEIVSVVALFIPRTAMISALVLALFCVVAPTLFHPFWTMPPSFERFLHKVHWVANIAIAGAFLVLATIPV
jgi:uncharacterized membrane protein YphA (DoxX/SURF4 family)